MWQLGRVGSDREAYCEKFPLPHDGFAHLSTSLEAVSVLNIISGVYWERTPIMGNFRNFYRKVCRALHIKYPKHKIGILLVDIFHWNGP